jgi:hypothetical protein
VGLVIELADSGFTLGLSLSPVVILLAFLNQGWVGEVIGVIGVGFGIYHFLHRAGPKFSYQS